MEVVKLGEVAQINPKLVDAMSPDTVISFIGMSDVDSQTGNALTGHDRPFSEVSKGYTQFLDGDILVAKITPCFENGKIAQASLARERGAGSTEFHVIRPDESQLDRRYLLHYLRQPWVRIVGERRMTGSAGHRRIPEEFVSGLNVPLPSLARQREVTVALDRVNGLWAKRREAIALLDELVESIYLDMFGTPEQNPRGLQARNFRELLQEPFRNGLSPSKAGGVQARVLTLSAITGTEFDGTAVKVSTFKAKPPQKQSVSKLDFLVCRGNGNRELVGAGFFPVKDMPDTTFPDTMMAAHISPDALIPEYLESVWKTTHVRRQIEKAARTTNGTFKINQKALEGVQLPVPPLTEQEEFASRVRAIKRLKSDHRKHLLHLDELFGSLQQRAFRGELWED